MPETPAAAPPDLKSPKPRRLKTPGDTRQVRFSSGTSDKDDAEAAKETKKETQPTSFPQVGAAPNGGSGSGSNLQWHTSATPAQSISAGGQLYATGGFAPQPQQQQQHPPSFPSAPLVFTHNPSFPQPAPITYIGAPSQHPLLQASMAADYQNCGPPSTGVNFQPPVPDTTFGPIPHVYVPRFDGGLAPGAHVGHAPVQFISAPACTTTVIMPKTFFLNGYTYYQPAVAPQPCPQGYVVAQQPCYIQPQPQPQQFVPQQPVMMASQPVMAPQPQHVPGMPTVGVGGGPPAMAAGYPVIAGNNPGHIPDVTGVGRTAGEEHVRQMHFARANRLYEPQEFKPADDDPSRFYFVREVDGNWTQRNRFTIDHMGDCRWYVTDEGWFYAVRLPD